MTSLSQQISQLSAMKVALATQQLAPKMALANAEPIAVVGMGCRFPGGANSPEAYWQLLSEGRDAIKDMSDVERWDTAAYYDADPEAPGKMAVKNGGFLDQVDKFDAQFFGISPREAAVLDPQQRLLMEVAWEALENGGIVPSSLHQSKTGVYIGITTSEYEKLCLQSDIASQTDNQHVAYMGTGNDTCAAAGRLSYSLGLTGPSLSVNTACSSSLVATHLACESLRNRACNMALAGGVNLTLIPDIYVVFSKAGMLSPDGRCKTFDAAANGYVRGEGGGVIVLKRLSDAIAEGDNVLAVIRGSAVNQDGRSSGLTVPNGPAQQTVVQQALDNSGLLAAQVGYVEAHGTGTSLGDPIEVGALGEVFRDREQPLIIGSAKTNIGHLESGAGMAGLIKTIMAVKHGEIPRNLHFNEPSPHIDWDRLPIQVATEHMAWPLERRIAGVSSFGYSGTNSHIVLEAAPEVAQTAPEVEITERPLHLLTLSARTREALLDMAGRYVALLQNSERKPLTDNTLANICATANTRRTRFAHSLAISAADAETMSGELAAFVAGDDSAVIIGQQTSAAPKTAFLFTGQGSQYAGMGRELYETQATFRAALDQCNDLLRPHLDYALLDVMYPEQARQAVPDGLINETAYTQPALFALEYALAQLWQSWGIQPEVMIGHSVGEYAAACIAGVFSLEDGIRLIAERGRLMQALPRDGAMLAIRAAETQVAAAVQPHADKVSLATINGPESVVISGDAAAVKAIGAQFDAEGVKTRELTVSHAFHSPLMEPMLAEFAQFASALSYQQPTIKIVSNLSGNVISDEMNGAHYWVEHVRAAVRFGAGMQTLAQTGCNVFIEIGAQPTLLGMGQACLDTNDALWLPSLRTNKPDWQQMLDSLGTLATRNIAIDWQGFEQGYSRQTVTVPTYPFQQQRHWLPENTQGKRSSDALRPLVDRMIQSPLLKETILETTFSTEALPYFNDHTVFDDVVVPGASHIAVILSGAELMRMDSCQLEDVIFPAPLRLPADKARKVQAILSPDGSSHAFQLISTDAEDQDSEADSEAITHATGYLRAAHAAGGADGAAGSDNINGTTVDLAALKASCTQQQSVDTVYDTAAEQHINFGPAFRWVNELWTGENEALAKLCLPDTVNPAGYWLHPGLLDACFQVSGVTLDEDGSETLLPFMLKRFSTHSKPVGDSWWCHVKQTGTASWDIQLLAEDGQAIASIDGFEMRAAPKDAMLQHQLADWLYTVDWQEQTLPAAALPATDNRWLIFSDGDLGEQLAAKLQAIGHSYLLVNQTEQYTASDDGSRIGLNPMQAADFHRLIVEQFVTTGTGCAGALYLWGTQAVADTDTPAMAQTLSVGALHLVQALREADLHSKLWLVTRGAQALGGEPNLYMAQAALWGLGRTLSIEHPELAPVCIDLARDEETDNVTAMINELAADAAGGQEPLAEQIAWRAGSRYVAQLTRHQDSAADKLQIPDGPYRVQLRDYGSPDELMLAPVERRTPAANEVEIEVKASALNFRDVLNSLGMLKEYYSEVLGIKEAKDIPLGFECAGTIIAVGADVTALKVGDNVVAATDGSFASHVTVEAALVACKPDNLDFESAAGTPTAFLTAYYGLYELAKLKAGDKILIHSAAGGVGQAAVQLAKAVGAEIYATASPGKWAALHAQGIEHVMNSRTLDFAADIMRLTEGNGVDVLLNSLNGDFIDSSFATLAENGRFVEIGKIGIWSQEQAAAHRPDVNYLPFDLGEETADDPSIITRMLNAVMDGFADGTYTPLPHVSFDINHIADAYRFMQQTKHIGKVALNFMPQEHASVQADASYLITGGVGALGLQVASSLVEQGARHLILASRSGTAPTSAADMLTKLRALGAEIVIAKADVAERTAVAALLAGIPAATPLRGIIHAAGVVDDGMTMQQNAERFAKAMAPKAVGACNLHQLTREMELDFFVSFSSIAALMGSPGQTNYSAANAVVDALMQQRRLDGLPGMSINWGPWAEIGMAADMSFGGEGLDKIAPDAGIALLNALMQRPRQHSPAQVGIFPMNWTKFMRQFSPGKEPAFLAQMLSQIKQAKAAKAAPAAGSENGDILARLQSAAPEARHELLLSYISKTLTQVLGLGSSQTVAHDQLWNELGLDSLMTVELKNALDRALHVSIPLETIMQSATSAVIAEMILARLDHAAEGDTGNAVDSAAAPKQKTHEEALDDDVEMLKKIPQTYVDVDEQRERQVLIDGAWRCDFASCNYLGMDLHPAVMASIPAAMEKWGVHPSWTRAVASPDLYPELERGLAELVGAKETLMFPSIHLLHIGVLPLLAGFGGVILKDNAAHHSIYEACLRSQADGIEWLEFGHNNLEDLENKLKRFRPDQNKIIAIDGVYSMSGEFPPLPEMSALAKQYNAVIYVDDAHGMGVIGEKPDAAMPYGYGGRGIVKYFDMGYEEDRIIYVGGLSKSFSSYGCFMTCFDQAMKARMSLAGPFVFSGPSPVASLASALAGLQVNKDEGDAMRANVYQLTKKLVDAAKGMGFEVDNEHYFPIVGVVIGNVDEVTDACQLMWQHNILITPAIYPAVAMHRNLVRFSITASNTEAEIEQAIAALGAVWEMVHSEQAALPCHEVIEANAA